MGFEPNRRLIVVAECRGGLGQGIGPQSFQVNHQRRTSTVNGGLGGRAFLQVRHLGLGRPALKPLRSALPTRPVLDYPLPAAFRETGWHYRFPVCFGVISGQHSARLTPRERTCPAPPSMSAKCQKQTFADNQELTVFAEKAPRHELLLLGVSFANAARDRLDYCSFALTHPDLGRVRDNLDHANQILACEDRHISGPTSRPGANSASLFLEGL